jgi:UDP:flavonoid glycosyltransferase YjiC (YdhE family)
VRVLVATTRGAGHFGPLVPFAAALARAGHEVLAAVPQESVGMAQRAGLGACALPCAPPEEVARIFRALPFDRPLETGPTLVRELFGRAEIVAALPATRELIAAWRPDLVLRETFHYASALAAEEAGVAHSRVAVGMARVDRSAVAIATQGYPGLAGAASAISRSPMLTLAPPSFDGPGQFEPAVLHRYREPAAQSVPGAGDPAWLAPGDAPLVYVTFGSLAPRFSFFPALLDAMLAALTDLPVRALITVGERVDPARLSDPPANTRIERWVAQTEVMCRAAAVVCHAGFGTLLGALQAGVPMVLVPMFSDQPRNAERVASLGAGIALPRGQRSAGTLTEAITKLLRDAAYATAARALAREIAVLPTPDAAIALLEQLTRG